MEKLVAYKFTLEEAEEALQNCLDNSGVKLVNKGHFYYAESDSQELDGAEIDERFAQILGVESGEHYVTENGLVFLVSEQKII